MPNLSDALDVLKQMAQLLDRVDLASGRTRYERLTNEYQDALDSEYIAWARGLVRQLKNAKDAIEQKQIIANASQTLLASLRQVGTEHLPYAVSAIGVADYVPSPDAWRMIAESIDAQNSDFENRLIPFIVERLNTGVDDGTDVQAVADSLLPRVSFYAGNLWITIQRLVGDYAAQAQTRDDLVYRCRWVRVKDDHSCQSCIEFAGEYDSYEAMLVATNQCVPGYFVGSPYKSACWLNCRCWIELYINGKWTRI